MKKLKDIICRIVMGRYFYKYEYYSPYGEALEIYHLWLWFIPIPYESFSDTGSASDTKVTELVKQLNEKRCKKN